MVRHCRACRCFPRAKYVAKPVTRSQMEKKEGGRRHWATRRSVVRFDLAAAAITPY